MKKMLLTVAIVLALLLLSALTAHAAALTMPDPLEMGYSMSFAEDLDNRHCYKRKYKLASASNVRDVVLAYMEELMQYRQLAYVECTTAPDGFIYHSFQAAEGYSYDTFYTYDDYWKTTDCCVSICYKPGNRIVYFMFSTDFFLWDENDCAQGNVPLRNTAQISPYSHYRAAMLPQLQ